MSFRLWSAPAVGGPCPAPAQQRAGPAASSKAPGGPALGGSHPPRLPSAPRTHPASGFSLPSRARCSDASLSHGHCLGFRVGEAEEAGMRPSRGQQNRVRQPAWPGQVAGREVMVKLWHRPSAAGQGHRSPTTVKRMERRPPCTCPVVTLPGAPGTMHTHTSHPFNRCDRGFRHIHSIAQPSPQPVLKHFPHPKKKLVSFSYDPKIHFPPSALGNHPINQSAFLNPINSPILDILYKQSDIARGLWQLASDTMSRLRGSPTS